MSGIGGIEKTLEQYEKCAAKLRQQIHVAQLLCRLIAEDCDWSKHATPFAILPSSEPETFERTVIDYKITTVRDIWISRNTNVLDFEGTLPERRLAYARDLIVEEIQSQLQVGHDLEEILESASKIFEQCDYNILELARLIKDNLDMNRATFFDFTSSC